MMFQTKKNVLRGKKRNRRIAAGVLVLSTALSLTSCEWWDWLWTRDTDRVPSTGELILTEQGTSSHDPILDGAVEYTGEAHSGTDIYYIGKGLNRDRIIVIDAGHQLKGSSEKEPNGPGSTDMKAEVTWGATGVYTNETEYNLNLRVSLLLRDELIRRGYSVVMIRETNNVSISNMERAMVANKYNASAYIRIHANSWTDETMHGALAVCHSARNPYPDCAATYEESRLLSELVLDEFCDRTGITKLNIREMDNMTGTNWCKVPTTILEMGFMSNRSDDTIMATNFFQQEAAQGIANGLDLYFEQMEDMKNESGSTSISSQAETSQAPSTLAQTSERETIGEEPSVTAAMEDPSTATKSVQTESDEPDPNQSGSEPDAILPEKTDGT